MFEANLARIAQRDRETVSAVIARSEATKQSISRHRWIASRSLSSGAHSRDPLARNDVLNRAPRSQPSSSAKADDPVFRGVSDRVERPRRTGYPPSRGMTAFARMLTSAWPTMRMRSACRLVPASKRVLRYAW